MLKKLSEPRWGFAGEEHTSLTHSGSNYVYSGYAPQLAAQLRISSTDTNLVGMGGNLGVYLTGPL